MILFITDSFTKLNGMSLFSKYFISWLCEKYDDNIFVYEVQSNQFISFKTIDNNRRITQIYVNGHFSRSDMLVRNRQLSRIIKKRSFNLSDDCSINIVSHGWQKVKIRFNLYSIVYNIKNFIKTMQINSISKHYSSIVFISNKSDDYRHYDYKWSLKNDFRFELMDFTKEIHLDNTTTNNSSLNNFILVISNCEPVKNLFLLFRVNFYYKIKNRKEKNFILLSTKPKSFMMKIILKLLILSKVKVIFDQSQKNLLIANCNYLFIPSHTEYLPIVALEALSMNKNVLSFYYIIGLSEFKKYHFLNK